MKEERVGQFFLAGLVVMGVLIIGGLVWAILAGPSPESQTARVETDLKFNDDNDPSKGLGEASVVVRMFGDFQCPSCRAAEPGLKYAMETYGDRVRFVWNDFPLTSIHPNARPAANAARCAEEQGKFWEYHDKLYSEQARWSSSPAPTESFLGYATELGLNTDSFGTCVASQTHLRKIQADEAEGAANRVTGTPTFFIGQKRFVGALAPEVWDAEIKAALGS